MKPVLILLALLALAGFSALSAAARADDTFLLPAFADVQLSTASQGRQAQEERDHALAERRQRMIEECVANHGYEQDCVREVDTELRAERLDPVHVRGPH